MIITAAHNEAALQELRQTMSDIEAVTRKAPGQVTSDVTIALLRSVKKRTTIGKQKKRRVRRNMEKYQQKRTASGTFQKGFKTVRGSRAPKWLIVRPRPDGKVDLIPTNAKNDPKRRINTRGVGFNSWGYMLARMGKAKGRILSAAGGQKFGHVKKRLGGSFPSVRLINDLGYMEDVNPGYQFAGMRAVNRGLQFAIEKRLLKPAAKAAV
jgi:hypothetical protein